MIYVCSPFQLRRFGLVVSFSAVFSQGTGPSHLNSTFSTERRMALDRQRLLRIEELAHEAAGCTQTRLGVWLNIFEGFLELDVGSFPQWGSRISCKPSGAYHHSRAAPRPNNPSEAFFFSGDGEKGNKRALHVPSGVENWLPPLPEATNCKVRSWKPWEGPQVNSGLRAVQVTCSFLSECRCKMHNMSLCCFATVPFACIRVLCILQHDSALKHF